MSTLPKIILASASPRRAQLLQESGYAFSVHPPTLSEPPLDPCGRPESQAMALSYFKARSVLESGAAAGDLVLGADTVVANAGQVFGKAVSTGDARRILTELSRAPHRVLTGFSLIMRLPDGTLRRRIACDVTRVTMRPMSELEMSDYLASGEWEGKAGAYGIQDCGDRYVTRIEGSFSNVVGLPLELLAKVLREWAPT